MPFPSPLVYSVAADTPNGKVVPDRLHTEVAASGVANFLHVEVDGDALKLHFSATVSDADKATADGVVAAHQAVSYNTKPLKAESNGISSTTATTPQDKIAFTPPPLRAGFYQMHWYAEVRVIGGLGDVGEITVGANGAQIAQTNWNRAEWHDFGGSFSAFVGSDGGTPLVWLRFRRVGIAGDTVEVRRARVLLIHEPLLA